MKASNAFTNPELLNVEISSSATAGSRDDFGSSIIEKPRSTSTKSALPQLFQVMVSCSFVDAYPCCTVLCFEKPIPMFARF